jgi:hypothetical protein
MRTKYDDLPDGRVPEEEHNVTLKAFVVAVKPCEGDHDYHVILKDLTHNQFVNAEVSGLPPDAPSDTNFKTPREEIETVLANGGASNTCGRYNKPPHPIPVTVTGSVYFDADHRAGCANGCPGPAYAKPSTVWEIHPILHISSP